MIHRPNASITREKSEVDFFNNLFNCRILRSTGRSIFVESDGPLSLVITEIELFIARNACGKESSMFFGKYKTYKYSKKFNILFVNTYLEISF